MKSKRQVETCLEIGNSTKGSEEGNIRMMREGTPSVKTQTTAQIRQDVCGTHIPVSVSVSVDLCLYLSVSVSVPTSVSASKALHCVGG